MRALLISLLAISTSASVLAQDPSAPISTRTETQTLMQGNADNGFLFAPDFKFTDVNGDFATIAGGYGGWVIDKKFLVGAGLYTMANGGNGGDMTYGGGVFEYFVNQGSLVNVSVRGLVGGGSATLSRFGDRDFGRGFGRGVDFGRFDFPAVIGSGPVNNLIGRFDDNFGLNLGDFDFDFASFTSQSTSFFIAEPEVNVIVNISEKMRFSVGGGYRFIGGAGAMRSRLDGFTANVGLKLSFF